MMEVTSSIQARSRQRLRLRRAAAARRAIIQTQSIQCPEEVDSATRGGLPWERKAALKFRSANFVLETLSPRIWRLGVRINWR